MEIKRVKEESYESISKYLDIILSISNSLSDLCFVDYDDKRYMLSIDDGKIAIVENNNGELNPYYIKQDNLFIETFGTEEYTYKIVTQKDLQEVDRKSTINNDYERLSYLPRIENYPRDVIEYVQFVDELISSITIKYDVTNRKGIEDAIIYCNYHTPDILKLELLKKVLFFYRKKSYNFSLGLYDNYYYQPLINIGDRLMFGTKRIRYDAKMFMEEIANKGFNKNIPSDLSSMLTGTNETYKTLKLVSENYQNYIKEQ